MSKKTKQKRKNLDPENVHKPFSFHTEFNANINLIEGDKTKVLTDKKVRVYHGARGLNFYKFDGNTYPVRTYTDGLPYQVEKKYKSVAVWIIPLAILAWYAQTIYMIYLQTGENYFNAVTLITVFFFAGAIYFVVRTLRRQMVNILFLKKQEMVYDKESFETTQMREQRTIIKNKGFSGTAVFAIFSLALIITLIVTSLIFQVGQLPLLLNSYEVNGWIQANSETAKNIMDDFAQSLYTIQTFIYIAVAVGVVVLVFNFLSIITNLKRKDEKKEEKYNIQSEALNYDPETQELFYLDPYYLPFENAQLDKDTLDASVLQEIAKDHIKAKATGDKEKIEETTFKDLPLVHKVEMKNLRGLVNTTYEDLTKKDDKEVDLDKLYSGMRVKDIIVKQNEQLKSLTEVVSLAIDRADLLEADRDAKEKAFQESVKRFEDFELESEALEVPETKKRMTPLSIVLIFFCAILFIILIILMVMLFNSGQVIPIE